MDLWSGEAGVCISFLHPMEGFRATEGNMSQGLGRGKGVTRGETGNSLGGEYLCNSRGVGTPRQEKVSWGGANWHAPGMGSEWVLGVQNSVL